VTGRVHVSNVSHARFISRKRAIAYRGAGVIHRLRAERECRNGP
jgi:hypothetical protein